MSMWRALARVRLVEPLAPGARTYAVPHSITKDDKRDFMATFPDIVRDLTNAGRFSDVPDAKNWYSRVLQHSVSEGKRLRGLTAAYSFKVMSPHDSDENVRLSHILGWCVEMFRGFVRGVNDPKGDVGPNDAVLIENGIYELLRIHFREKPYYVNLVELFHDTAIKTGLGHTLDGIAANSARSGDLSKFTMDRYNAIVKYKTSFYTFHLPVALAMHMAGISDDEHHRQAKSILLEMGRFFQIQDDYEDVFGDNASKLGSDIREGKCSWLAVVALQRSTPEHIRLMQQCYGSPDPEKLNQVKDLYLHLGLPSIFNAYEEELYKMIYTSIQQISRGMPHDLFFNLLENIYKRFR